MDAVLVVGPPNGKIHYYHVFKEMAEKLHVRDTPIVDRSNKKKKKTRRDLVIATGVIYCVVDRRNPRRGQEGPERAGEQQVNLVTAFSLVPRCFVCCERSLSASPCHSSTQTARLVGGVDVGGL
jgi:hypothetical protein